MAYCQASRASVISGNCLRYTPSAFRADIPEEQIADELKAETSGFPCKSPSIDAPNASSRLSVPSHSDFASVGSENGTSYFD